MKLFPEKPKTNISTPYFPETEKQPENKPLVIPKQIIFVGLFILVMLSMISSMFVLNSTNPKKTINIQPNLPNISSKDNTQIIKEPTAIPTPTPDPTISWQTYLNKSFTIRYPARFTITEQPVKFSSLYPKVYTDVIFADGNTTIEVTVAKNSPNFSLDTILGQGPGVRYNNTLVPAENIRRSTIDGINALIVSRIPTGQGGTAVDILLIKDGKIYQLSLTPIDADPTTFLYMLKTFSEVNQEPSDATDNWLVYTDAAYHYAFKYPPTYGVDHAKVASGSPALTRVFDKSSVQVDTPKFQIETQDPNNFGQSAVTSRALLKLPLDEYVSKKWDYNKSASDAAVPNKIVSPIKAILVGGNSGYYFTVNGKYQDDIISELLSEEYVYAFTESNGYKIKAWYPKANTTFTQIFNTLTFYK